MQCRNVLFHVLRRVAKRKSVELWKSKELSRIVAVQLGGKLIGMRKPYVVRLKRVLWEVRHVESYQYTRAGSYRRGKDMTVT